MQDSLHVYAIHVAPRGNLNLVNDLVAQSFRVDRLREELVLAQHEKVRVAQPAEEEVEEVAAHRQKQPDREQLLKTISW